MSISLFFAGFFLLLSWLLPIHYKPWLTAYPEFLAVIALCLALLGLVLNARAATVKAPKPILGIVLLAGVPLAQWATGVVFFSADAWLSAGFLWLLAASVLVGFNLQLQENSKETEARYSVGFAWLLLAGAVISSAIAVLQWLGLADSIWVHPLKPGARPYANIAQPNNLATLLGFGLVGLLYLFEIRRVPSWVAVGSALLVMLGLALAQSRTTWLVAVFIVVFWYFQSQRLALRLSTWRILLWVAVFALISLCLPWVAGLMGESQRSIVERAGSNARWDMYLHFFEAIKNSPWFGYGWNQAITAQYETAHLFPPRQVTLYSHNVFIDLLIWNGPYLGAAIIGALVFWFVRMLMLAKTLVATICWLALSFFIVHSLLEFPYAYAFLLIPAGVLIGMLVAETQPQASFSINKITVGLVALVFATSTAWVWHEYTIIEEEHWLAISLLPGQAVPIEHGQALSRIQALDHLSAYTAFISLPISQHVEAGRLEQTAQIVKRYPHFYTLLKVSYLLALNGQAEQAFEYMQTLKYMYGEDRFNQALQYLENKSAEQPELSRLVDRFQ